MRGQQLCLLLVLGLEGIQSQSTVAPTDTMMPSPSPSLFPSTVRPSANPTENPPTESPKPSPIPSFFPTARPPSALPTAEPPTASPAPSPSPSVLPVRFGRPLQRLHISQRCFDRRHPEQPYPQLSSEPANPLHKANSHPRVSGILCTDRLTHDTNIMYLFTSNANSRSAN